MDFGPPPPLPPQHGTTVAIDLKPLAPPSSPPPPPGQKPPILPPPAFDDRRAEDPEDDDDDDEDGGHGHNDVRGRHRGTLPAPPPPFQRQSLGRCSVQQPMTGNGRSAAIHHYAGGGGMVSEYFIPRSVSVHDLCSAIELQKIPPPLPPSALRTTAATLARAPRPPTASRDKMVTFEDEKLAFDQHRQHQHHAREHHQQHQHQQQHHHRSSGDLIV